MCCFFGLPPVTTNYNITFNGSPMPFGRCCAPYMPAPFNSCCSFNSFNYGLGLGAGMALGNFVGSVINRFC